MCATESAEFIAQSRVSATHAEQGIRVQFFPASDSEADSNWTVGGSHPIKLIGSTSATSTWHGFDTRPISVDRWNVDFSGPCFESDTEPGDGIIETLVVSVTTIAPSSYPIKTTGYLYDGHSGCHLGLLDLRYFGMDLPRTLSFSLGEHRFPMSTQIEIRFGVDGGGSPLILRPPTITSVGILLTERRSRLTESPLDEVPPILMR
ncbi:hypothetical protein [Paraburkholderia ginsengiterrae]|uniref:hypothetical protein n=1 Tax=Paraburkholderia ginsengiterrae TaxID=1462993 RepID=UPI00104226FC|nr:hypothetical protein [Paraburkholderia ginsengiterrae]